MFHGKVTILKKVNGRTHKLEKEFSNESEYQRFLAESSESSTQELPMMNLWQWSQFHNYLDNLVEHKLGYYDDEEEEEYLEEEYHEPSGLVDFTKYHEKAIQRMHRLKTKLEL